VVNVIVPDPFTPQVPTYYEPVHVFYFKAESYLNQQVKNPALTGGALKNFKTISAVCCDHDADT